MEEDALNLSTKECQPLSTAGSSELDTNNEYRHDSSSSRGHFQSTLPPVITSMPIATESLFSSPPLFAGYGLPSYSGLSYWGGEASGQSEFTSIQNQCDSSLRGQPFVYETTPFMPSHPFATQTQAQLSSLYFAQSKSQQTTILPTSDTNRFPLRAAATYKAETSTNEHSNEDKRNLGTKKQPPPPISKSKRGRKKKAITTPSASAAAPSLSDRPVSALDIDRESRSEQPVPSTSASEQEQSEARKAQVKCQKQRERNKADSKRFRDRKKAKYEEDLRRVANYVAENEKLRSELEAEKAVNSMLRSILYEQGVLLR
ncbi:CCAAT/enhancer-binding protein epsilon [Orchesella cincta]|uniref:CCAAT/enhancer-binding protein epsilon n=1 Tax=Orchesella cincta TaxID=48709 RepID=A0A1D2M9L7_ORCCI|nr:CCAAT/enhancer-binding protein epsilon [Orchesella cincta]